MHDYDGQAVYGDADLYEHQSGALSADLDFYLREALATGGPALECACGTGRVTLHLARAGLEVTGVDLSRPMLDRAIARAAAERLDIAWVHADIRTWSGGRRFRFVYIPYNALLHLLDRESLELFLARVREHLLPGGRFALNIFKPHLPFLLADPEQRRVVFDHIPAPGGGEITIVEQNRYDAATQINHVLWTVQRPDGSEERQELNLRMYFPAEMDALLHYNGFRIVRKDGDFQGTPFGSGSSHQVFVCEVRG